ncbi:UPF0496 protein 4-like [Zingiber officinale]|uniref:Uncharacterized protein n=1 Tax=Zingiber officinale TaxID=94328 RepID=A0A8J5L2E7_ZINOF|nr:UPF0496 protein 4-like [Zingiber officinale]KAG6498340.1 hypothetical protein ZIOFF_046252 [Zingiber officinale]
MLFVHKDASARRRFPFFASSPPKSPPGSLARPFEDTVAARLADLLRDASSLSWLARAVRVLALILDDAAALLADSSASSSDLATLACYLDSGVVLLDICNAASAEIDRLLRRRLHLRFAIHAIATSDGGRDAERLRKARDSLAEWTACARRSIKPSIVGLVRSLAPANPPRGKISIARRVIYAVEAVSSLIAGILVAVLGGSEQLTPASVPSDLPWAKEYNDLAAAISCELVGDRFAAELDAAEAAVKTLTDVISTDGDGENTETTLRKYVESTEKATGGLTEALDELSNAVNGLFRSALGLRNVTSQAFRVDSCN